MVCGGRQHAPLRATTRAPGTPPLTMSRVEEATRLPLATRLPAADAAQHRREKMGVEREAGRPAPRRSPLTPPAARRGGATRTRRPAALAAALLSGAACRPSARERRRTDLRERSAGGGWPPSRPRAVGPEPRCAEPEPCWTAAPSRERRGVGLRAAGGRWGGTRRDASHTAATCSCGARARPPSARPRSADRSACAKGGARRATRRWAVAAASSPPPWTAWRRKRGPSST
mmetsp:Transcript_20121/g.64295  ORF Transcript_20121/g.64295 Transcript_20121/m.64295 type:complete len:231 (-) Transcript_20121:67-759(-)